MTGRWILGFMFLLALVAGALLWQWSRPAVEPPLPVFSHVPDFELVERNGQRVTRADLLGRVWVVDFVFTRCVDACPLVSRRMAELHDTFAARDVRFVSITVDPEHDTPEVLSRYARHFTDDPEGWWFLTGDKKAIYRLARDGFRLGVTDPQDAGRTSWNPLGRRLWRAAGNAIRALQPAAAWAHHDAHGPPREAILHSARFVLVDRQGRIRGYYDSREEAAMRRLQRHLTRLLQEHDA